VKLLLAPCQIDVWRAHLPDLADARTLLADPLSDDEWQRAAAFHLRGDGDAFVLRRGLLRMILSSYLDCRAADLRFRYGPFGKPFLDGNDDLTRFSFSLSHAREMVLCAVHAGGAVGVDVEFVGSRPQVEAIAARFLSRTDSESIRRLPEDERLLGFYSAWTRQEAYLKASGEGFSSASVGNGHGFHAGPWKVEGLMLGTAYVGAIVGEGIDWRLRLLDWRPTSPGRG
jgi:4'-phosphopantetheinyl transferase